MIDASSITVIILFSVGVLWFIKDALFKGPLPAEQDDGIVPAEFENVSEVEDDRKPVSPRVAALKSDDAVPAKVAPKARPVPTKTTLLKMTKADIAKVAKTFGVDLNIKKTKAEMVKEFQTEMKAQAKARQ